MKRPYLQKVSTLLGFTLAGLSVVTTGMRAQETDTSEEDENEVIELNPFVVSATEDMGYLATSTLAGTRLKTALEDVATTATVITKEMMEDLGADDAEEVLTFTAGAEVAGTKGNFTNASPSTVLFGAPNDLDNIRGGGQGTRIRALASADLTRNYVQTSIPFDGYNSDRITVNRGSNAVLFGLGSPAGIVDNTTKKAMFKDKNNVQLSADSLGSLRGTLDFNKEILKNEFAVRVASVADREEFEQNPAYKDTNRIHLAGTYQKDFVGPNDRTWGFTIIHANFEKGQIRSNLPRTTPPTDLISSWFTPHSTDVLAGLTQQTKPAWDAFRGALVGSGDIGNYQVTAPVDPANATFENPELAVRSSPFFGETPVMIFEGESNLYPSAPGGANLIGYLGQIPSLISRRWTSQRTGSEGYGWMMIPQELNGAIRAYTGTVDNPGGVDYGPLFKQPVLTDESIFNFRKTLIDGPTKSEAQDFSVHNISLQQLLFDGKAGIELSYADESYTRRFKGVLDYRNALTIDVNAVLLDGTVNPNFGRPMVYGRSPTQGQFKTDRENLRATAYYDIDFRDNQGLSKWIGRHVITGVLTRYEENSSSFTTAGLWDVDLMENWIGREMDPTSDAIGRVNTAHYLGDSLADLDSPVGANIPGLQVDQWPTPEKFQEGATSVRVHRVRDEFNGTPLPDGFHDIATSMIVGPISGGLSRELYKSQAVVLQSYLLNDNLVGTFSWRNDEVDSRVNNSPEPLNNGTVDLDPANYNLDNVVGDNVLLSEKETLAWGLVAKVPDSFLDWSGGFITKLHGFYNQSENFQPSAVRQNALYEPVGPPTGETTDYGFRLGLMNDKFILKATWYETSQKNITAGGSWQIPFVAQMWRNFYNNADRLIGMYQAGTYINPQGYIGYYPGTDYIHVDTDGDTIGDVVISSPPEWFKEVYGMEFTPGAANPWSFQDPKTAYFTEDVESEGLELELIWNPTTNWRIAINATRQEAVRSGAADDMVRFYDEVPFFDTDLDGTPDVPFRTAFFEDFKDVKRSPTQALTFNFDEWWNVWLNSARVTNGQSSPEIAKWKMNLITNYNFKRGVLKGFKLGGSVQWREAAAIGYGMTQDELGTSVLDVNQPIYGDDFFELGAWIGYERALWKGMWWNIQLNVRNLFDDDDLVPVSANPDGTVVGYRIPRPRVFELRSTFSF